MPEFETVRFGTIKVPEEEQIIFRRGLLGFEKLRKFVHLELEAEAPLSWLQSLDDPKVAFVVANPAVFFPDYRIEIDVRELGDVKPAPNDRLTVLGICTIPDRIEDVSMNLQGPLIISTTTGRGKQIVLNRSKYSTRHPLAHGPEGEAQPGQELTPEPVAKRARPISTSREPAL